MNKSGSAFPVQKDLSMEEPQILSLFMSLFRGKHLQGSMTVAYSVPGYWGFSFSFQSLFYLKNENSTKLHFINIGSKSWNSHESLPLSKTIVSSVAFGASYLNRT